MRIIDGKEGKRRKIDNNETNRGRERERGRGKERDNTRVKRNREAGRGTVKGKCSTNSHILMMERRIKLIRRHH